MNNNLITSFSHRPVAALAATLMIYGSALAQQTCPADFPRTTPDSDFADAGNGTVRHIPTGLIWKRCAEGQTWDGTTCQGTASSYIWQQAFQQADAVNAVSYAGQTDWRVPNINELKSITEMGCYNPSINLTQFPATPESYFWSGSPLAGSSYYAWVVSFGVGLDQWYGRNYAYQVRLVRAGQYFYNFDAAVAAPTISSSTPPDGTAGTPYSFTVTASGSPTFGATGLPPGLSINPTTGAITGTPSAPGTYNVTVTASNAGGAATANYSITIAAAVAAAPIAIPTLSEWGLIILSLLMAGAVMLGLRREE